MSRIHSRLVPFPLCAGFINDVAAPNRNVTKLTDFLFLSGCEAVTDANVRRLNITCIINCAIEVRNIITIPGVEIIKLNIHDLPTSPIHLFFHRIINKINEVRDKKGRTLVHCFAGISRSATLVIAYLVHELGYTLRQAHDFVRSKRPCIQPNIGFWKQLIELENKKHKLSSVFIIRTPFGTIPDLYRSSNMSKSDSQTTQGTNSSVQKVRAPRSKSSFSERGSLRNQISSETAQSSTKLDTASTKNLSSQIVRKKK